MMDGSRGRVRGLVRAPVIYGLGMIVQQLVGAFLLPIYTHWLEASSFGIFEVLSRTRDVFLLTAGSAVALTTIAFYQLAEDDTGKRRVALAALVIQLVLAGALALAMLAVARPLSAFLLGSADRSPLVALLVGVFFFDALHLVPLAMWQAQVRAATYVAFQSLIPVTRAGLIIIFLVGLHGGLRGLLVAWLLNSAFHAILMTILLGRYLRPWPGWPGRDLVRRMVAYGWPFLPNSAAGFLLSSGDRYFLAATHGAAVVGLYGVGYRLAVLAWAGLFIPFQKVWSAFMIRLARKEEYRPLLAEVVTGYLGVHATGLLGFLLVGPEILSVLADRSYAPAWAIVPVIVGAQYWQTVIALLDAAFYAAEATRTKATITISGALLVIILYATTIPRWGIGGAAWSTLATYLLLAVTTDIVSRRVLWLPIRRWVVYGLPGLAAVLYAGAWTAFSRDGRLPWLVKVAVLGSWLLLTVGLRLLRPRDLLSLVQRLRQGGASANPVSK